MVCSLLRLAALATVVTSSVEAMPSFLKLIPGSQNVPGVEAIGHVYKGGGGGLNGFGEDFLASGKTWSVALCYMDSDGDGQFNGAELGDPCCEWVQSTNEKLLYTTATAPGDKTSKQDPVIWSSVKCANGQDPQAKYIANGGTNNTSPSNNGGDATVTPKPSTVVPSPTPSSAGVGVVLTTTTFAVTAFVVAGLL